MALTFVPYLYAWAMTPAGMRYQWLLYNPDEPNVHLAWMKQAADGHWAFIDPFTSEAQPRTFCHLLFLVLGLLSRTLHLPLVGVYHGFRFLAGVLLLNSIYRLTADFFPAVSVRKTAVWVAGLSSGLGWLAFALNERSIPDPDLWGLRPVDVSRGLMMPEGFTFPSLLLYPLFTFSMLLMVCCFRELIIAQSTNGRGHLLVAGVSGLLLGNMHTYNLLVVHAVLIIWLMTTIACQWRGAGSLFGRMTFFVLVSCPGLVYQFVNFRVNPIFREKALTPTPPPQPLDMIVSYGAVLLLAVAGALLSNFRNERNVRLLVCWLAVGAVIIYAPVSFSRKMIEGLHIPMSILASFALVRVANQVVWGLRAHTTRVGILRHRKNLILAVAIFGMSLSNIQFVRLMLEWVSENNASRLSALMPPYYLSVDDLAAAEWLEHNAPSDAVVLCLPYLGSYIPSVSGRRVFIGHWAETLRFKEKLSMLRDFLTPGASAETQIRSAVEGSLYFIYGLYEHLVAPTWTPPRGWKEVYRQGSSTIYQYSGQ